MKRLFFPLVLLNLSIFLGGCSRQPNIESVKDATKISAEALFSEYKADRFKAAEKYQGKILEVTGIVDKTGTDVGEHPFVNLKGQEQLGGVQCFFLKLYEEKATQLKAGQKVTIRGKCTAYIMNVLVEGSMIVQS